VTANDPIQEQILARLTAIETQLANILTVIRTIVPPQTGGDNAPWRSSLAGSVETPGPFTREFLLGQPPIQSGQDEFQKLFGPDSPPDEIASEPQEEPVQEMGDFTRFFAPRDTSPEAPPAQEDTPGDYTLQFGPHAEPVSPDSAGQATRIIRPAGHPRRDPGQPR